jgi:putative flippase GtrA
MKNNEEISRFFWIINIMKNFGLIAGLGWIFDVFIFISILNFTKIPISGANILSSFFAASVVYIITHAFLYRSGRRSLGGRLTLYLLYTAAIILSMSVALDMLARVLAPNIGRSQALLMAKVLITPPQFLLNFMVSRYLASGMIRLWQ